MRTVATLLTDRLRLARVQRAFDRHSTVDPCESWSALAEHCARRKISLVLLDLFAIAGVSTEAVFDEVRELRRRHPTMTFVLYMDAPAARSSDLFDAGRLGIDGLVLVDEDDAPERLVERVANAEASSVARLMRPILAETPATVRDAISVCVSQGFRKLTPDALARRIGVTRRRLTLALAGAGFPSPRRLIAWGRLIMAGHLLEDADRPANEVARSLGFPSGSGFRNACRRYLHCAPREVRERGGAGYVMAMLMKRASGR